MNCLDTYMYLKFHWVWSILKMVKISFLASKLTKKKWFKEEKMSFYILTKKSHNLKKIIFWLSSFLCSWFITHEIITFHVRFRILINSFCEHNIVRSFGSCFHLCLSELSYTLLYVKPCHSYKRLVKIQAFQSTATKTLEGVNSIVTWGRQSQLLVIIK